MQINLKTDYSLRLLLFVATHPGEVVSVGRVAEVFGISANHLTKVARSLANLGLVEMVRGRSGGLRLSCDPKRVRVGEVVRLIEGTAPLVECFDAQTNGCVISPVCALKGALRKAQSAFFGVLDGYSLEDLTRNRAQLQKLLNR
jgi:Rrf2 family nitric oxide-sensitive transcriptional repressor